MKPNTVTLQPKRQQMNLPGTWISINRSSGVLNFSPDLCEKCDWIGEKKRVLIEYDIDKNTLKFYPDESGFMVNTRKRNGKITSFGLTVREIGNIGIPRQSFNKKNGNFGRFSVRLLKKSFICTLSKDHLE